MDSFLALYNPAVQRIAVAARSLILEVMPGAIEQVDAPSKIVAYGYGTKYADLICAIAPFKTYVNLMFSRGVDLEDPQGLLVGTGKRARHIKLTTVDEVHQPAVREMIQRAVQLATG
ncbi:MAG TPA: DUF1801 domain-containing protein [Anaerolineaceae bacterium]